MRTTRPRRRRWNGLLGTAAAGLLAAGCQQAPPDRPPAPPTLEVVLDEYRVEAPEQVPAGRVVVEVVNAGDEAHNLTVLALPEDFPATFEERFASGQRQALGTLVILPAQPPGAEDVVALDLAPGRYGLLSTLEDDEGTSHARKGMAAQLEAVER